MIIEYCHRYGSCSSFTNLEQKKMDPPLNISHPNGTRFYKNHFMYCNVKQVPMYITHTYIAYPCSAIFYIIQMVLMVRLTGTHYILDPNGHSVRFKIFTVIYSLPLMESTKIVGRAGF